MSRTPFEYRFACVDPVKRGGLLGAVAETMRHLDGDQYGYTLANIAERMGVERERLSPHMARLTRAGVLARRLAGEADWSMDAVWLGPAAVANQRIRANPGKSAALLHVSHSVAARLAAIGHGYERDAVLRIVAMVASLYGATLPPRRPRWSDVRPALGHVRIAIPDPLPATPWPLVEHAAQSEQT